jgi:dienelactone hydrolase
VFDVTPGTHRCARAAAAALVLTLAGAGACSSGDDDTADADPGASGAPADPAGQEATPEAPFATGHRTMTLVDAGRPTPAVPDRLPESPDRTIEVDVVYPADGEAGPAPTGDPATADEAVDDAPPAPGTFPLVVFAHGWNGRADMFLGFAERWAREGYVVALPTFPLSQEGIGVSDDLINQPGDISFVIDELAGLGDDDPLAGRVDVEHVAVGGHSLGSATVFGVAYNSCCIDERIDATIPVSGGSLPFEGGDYEDLPATPMLLVHGAQDPLVPVGAGDAMFEQAEPPVWYLRPTEGDHVSVFSGQPGQLFNDAALAFLDAHLRGDDDALEAMADHVEASGAAEWRTKPAAP